MSMMRLAFLPFLGVLFALSQQGCGTAGLSTNEPSSALPKETHIRNLKQLTFGGTNAEAYWSFDGKWLTFQHKGPGLPGLVQPELDSEPECDQIFAMRSDGTQLRGISNSKGRTTCSHYLPDDSRILFSSTHGYGEACPAEPDKSKGYLWPIYNTYQMYTAKPDGTDILPLEPGAPRAYNAEGTVCKDGSVIFTSDRDGDLDLYVGKLDRLGVMGQLRRITQTLGYDGGAFFNEDCSRIVWRASRPRPGKEAEEYKALLKQHLVRPSRLEIWTANADGSHARQLTRLGAASFAPFFTPDGKSVIFASNPRDPKGRMFDLYQVKLNGTRLEQVTHSDTFDSFPMFSPNGKQIVFASNRNGKERETNLFVGDWVKGDEKAISVKDSDPVNRFQAMVETLSSPEFDGRGVNTRGLEKAEAEVQDWFTAAGLKPFFSVFPKATGGKGYLQSVEIQTSIEMSPTKTVISFAGLRALKPFEDFVPASFSASKDFAGSVVDAGYGVIAPELGIDDYHKANVKNQIALIRRHVPKTFKLSRAQEQNYGDLRFKTFLAKSKGAKAVIFYEADNQYPDDLPKTLENIEAGGDAGIPVFFIKRALAPSVVGKKVSGKILLERKSSSAHNVVGVLGEGCDKRAPIVVGAHLDHLGRGSSSSLEPEKNGLHPGADDNASGVAAIIVAAQMMAADPISKKRCTIFAAFTGEEVGIVGSTRLTELLKKIGVRPKAMINLDMVGRMENNTLLTFGTDSGKEWKDILKEGCDELLLNCSGGGDGYGPSDHMPFYISEIPVVHFFTGAHPDYHRGSDLAERINATGGVQVAELVARTVRQVADGRQKLAYQRAKQSSSMGALRGRGDKRSFGGYLGTIPDYGAMNSPSGPGGAKSSDGVKLAGSRAGSPAEKAGVRAGDRLMTITEFSGTDPQEHQISSLEDFMYVLTGLRPGQKVILGVKRGEKVMQLPATVGTRE